ncbi:Lrp/AsnC family transcriptional regulator [Pelagibius sp. Alg239-R121]|uniref:Lrp/AsnC family transcriptional regulator n=1 Tax=Pelagibius sp. Alg239-R121 TaxID=2993448 RepID=UPI0024A77D28|nr:Lrp/AsnC family transcriptional regulator [Pelagibius sp. Alg239-R121]
MDDLDYKLVQLLRQDARLPVASLASFTKVSRATVKARIDKLVKNGIIEKFTLQMGSEVRNAAVRAMVLVEVHGRKEEQVSRELLKVPQVHTVHSTNGRWDLIAELEVQDLPTFDRTLRKIRSISGISNTETNILLSTRRPFGF